MHFLYKKVRGDLELLENVWFFTKMYLTAVVW